jgi:hypothetical protein
MKKEINALIIEREELKHELSLVIVDIKQAVESTGLLSSGDSKKLTPESMQGMGAMMAIPALLSKITPLKACFPQLAAGFDLLIKINDVNEQIQSCLIYAVCSGEK